MSLSDTASTSKLQHPRGDVVEEKPEAVMLAFMAEMREQMSSQNREIAALRQVVSVMAAPVGRAGAEADAVASAVDRAGAEADAAAPAAAPAAAAGLSAGRVMAPCHPPRCHELLVYNDAAETMADFFVRFERHCASEYRGTYDDALPLLRSKLSGRVLELFDVNGPRSSYQVIKRRLLEWASRQGSFEVSSATAMYRDAARRPGESLAVYAFRLAALFEDAYPEVDKQVSHDLRLKLLSTLPTCAADFLRRQLRYALVNHNTTLTWNGLVSYLECESFKSEAEDTLDSLYARTSAQRGSRSEAKRRPCSSSRPRMTSPRPHSAYSDSRSTAGESDSDSDYAPRSVSLARGTLESRVAPGGRRRAPATIQLRSPVRERRTASPRSSTRESLDGSPLCDFCRRRGHTKKECRRANDLCFTCGVSGHYARDCPVTRDDETGPSVPDHLHRSGSPRPSSGTRHASSGSTVAHEERGDSRLRRRGGRAPVPSRSEN